MYKCQRPRARRPCYGKRLRHLPFPDGPRPLAAISSGAGVRRVGTFHVEGRTMVLVILRALFILLMAAVGWFFLTDPRQFWGAYTWMAMAVALVVGVLFVCIDILAPRKKLAIFSGTFFGLVVGIM